MKKKKLLSDPMQDFFLSKTNKQKKKNTMIPSLWGGGVVQAEQFLPWSLLLELN